MRPSIRDIEGYNSIMKWMGKIAPNIKLKLMASRLALKKMLGGSGQDCQDQSRMARLSARERRERVLDGMVERHAQTIAILRQCQDLSRDEWLPQALASLMGAPDESFELSVCLADEAEEFIVEEEELDEDEANEARELIVHEGSRRFAKRQRIQTKGQCLRHSMRRGARLIYSIAWTICGTTRQSRRLQGVPLLGVRSL